ncbi:MAG: adenylosuccinate lyase [Deltaproteobacteria bacterium]|nr:adenylosuccinate lyase [Deltaproteobacteria bacterium]
MIPRYQAKAIAKIFSDETRYGLWLKVELETAKAAADAGLIPRAHADALATKLPALDTRKLTERALILEETLKHDVIAFLAACEEHLDTEAASLHYGLTSSDVVDTTLAVQLRDATQETLTRIDALLEALHRRIDEHKYTEMVGRSHGMHGEPTTFGIVLAGHYAEIARQRRRVAAALTEIRFGKLSGAVGTFAHLSPAIEAAVMRALDLSPEPLATQVVPRDRHAVLFTTIAGLGASIERLATNIRHWQRSELQEAEEPFTAGQRGSSAMPHKRNPIGSENLCGVARMLRGYALAALEDVALWHERDISHSSVERVIGPDAFHLAVYALERLTKIVTGLAVYPQNMTRNLASTHGLVASQTVLLELVRAGVPRQKAYGIVQRNAMAAWERREDFLTLCLRDAELVEVVKDPEALRAKAKVSKETADLLIQRALSP